MPRRRGARRKEVPSRRGGERRKAHGKPGRHARPCRRRGGRVVRAPERGRVAFLPPGAVPGDMALSRPRQTMPAAVRRALGARGLLAAYRARPPYQRNDYLTWIKRAKRPETREKRLGQMLDELAAGDSYMGMAWRAKGASGWTCPKC